MSSLEERIKQFHENTKLLLEEVERYKSLPDPILIDEKTILSGVAKALLAGATLLAPKMAVVAGILKVGGKVFEWLANKKEETK